MEHFLNAIKNYATFTGRATRQQYWMFILFYLIFYIMLSLIDGMLGLYNMEAGAGLLSGIYSLALLIPSIAILARRLHDIDRTGWWILLLLIPLVGALVILIFTLLDSKREENQWGASPKYGKDVLDETPS